MFKTWVGRHRTPLLFGAVFVIALTLRFVHFWGQWESNPLFLAPNMDERKHHEWAQLIANGQTLGPKPFFRAPLYYYGLAALYKAAGPSIPVARGLGCVLGAATCLLIALLGNRLAGPRAGLFAGLLAACYWPFIHNDQLLLSVGLETFLGISTLLLLFLAARRNAWWITMAAGCAFGLSAITRPTVLTFAPAMALWVVFGADLLRPGEDRADSWRVRLKNLAIAGGAAAAMIAPVTLHNRVVGGEWVLVATNGGLNFFIGNNPGADGVSAAVPGTRTDWDGGYEDTHAVAQRDWGPRLGRSLTEGEVSDFWYQKGWAWIRSDPAGAIRLTLRKLALFWTPVEIPNNNAVWFFASMSPLARLYVIGFPIVAVLGVAGFALLPRSSWRMWWLPVSFGLIGMSTVVAFFVVDRYRMPMVPVLMLGAGAGLSHLWESESSTRLPALRRYLFAALMMVVLELLCRPGAAFWREGSFFEAQEKAQGERALGDYYLLRAGGDASLMGEALRHYDAAVAALPMSPDIQFALGAAMLRSANAATIGKAGRPLELAIGMRPAFADARRLYAEWLVRQGRSPEAIAQYRVVLKQQPWGDSYQASLIGLGILLLERGQPEEAGSLLLDALRNDPSNRFAVEGLLGAAQGIWQGGRVRDSIELLRRGLAYAPGQRPLLLGLRDAYVSNGEIAKARELEARVKGIGAVQ